MDSWNDVVKLVARLKAPLLYQPASEQCAKNQHPEGPEDNCILDLYIVSTALRRSKIVAHQSPHQERASQQADAYKSDASTSFGNWALGVSPFLKSGS